MTPNVLFRLGAIAAALAGLLRVSSSFLVYSEPTVGRELLYLTIDLGILFGLLAIYFHQYVELGKPGVAAFVVALSGTAIIVGPDGFIGSVPMYQFGSTLLLGGLSAMAILGWNAARIPRYALASWLVSLALGIGSTIPGAPPALVAWAGLALGIGVLGAGLRIWSSASSAQDGGAS
ncbi:MAG: hypothetical protein HOP14_12780 [Acidobacteria bacterium]|nr:hypothetical protein [Acidobacteriota bacterium]